MREELLRQLKKELEDRKKENTLYNEKVKKIRELQRDSKVKEYLQLTGLISPELKQLKISDEKLILSFYRQYLSEIKEGETNGIFVYMGTYQNSNEIDIIHGSHDLRVDYHSSDADYREYRDIEQCFSVTIPILKCNQFESEHIVVNPKAYLSGEKFYKIQEEFFVRAVKSNQESAKKMVLRKYDRLGK